MTSVANVPIEVNADRRYLETAASQFYVLKEAKKKRGKREKRNKKKKKKTYSSPSFLRFLIFSRSSIDRISCRQIGANCSCCPGVSSIFPFRPSDIAVVDSEPQRLRIVSLVIGLNSPSSPSRSLCFPPDHVGSNPLALAEEARWLMGLGKRRSRDLLYL